MLSCCNRRDGNRLEGETATSVKVVQQVIDEGAVPKFVEFLQRCDNHTLQLESAWVLTEIANSRIDHTQVVVDNGAVPILVHLLVSRNNDICEQAVSW